MAELRSCMVSIRDVMGVRHSVEVPAESLYEAAALGLRALVGAEFVENGPALATVVEIEVRHVVARHELPVSRLRNWLYGASRSPAERVLKDRLRAYVPWLRAPDG